MSYVLEITPNAFRDLTYLPVWLQEETLDELEKLCRDPYSLQRRGAVPGLVSDFLRIKDGARYYVFLVLRKDETCRRLIVTAVGMTQK